MQADIAKLLRDLARGMANEAGRRALAQAITLAESRRADHRRDARALLAALPLANDRLRLGITGAPGVGKSTLIARFAHERIRRGAHIAVLTVDPSSNAGGGALLGDKTRMAGLSSDLRAFVRPSSADGTLGGVSRHTRDAIALCEAAGADLTIVETVGVGQSEHEVARMTDIFILMIAPGGGDSLQGLKRGVMELADIILVNKADGALAPVARSTVESYMVALSLMRKRRENPESFPKILPVSAHSGVGLDALHESLDTLEKARRASGAFAARRTEQAVDEMRAEIESGIQARFSASEAARLADRLEASVRAFTLSPREAAAQVLQAFSREEKRNGA